MVAGIMGQDGVGVMPDQTALPAVSGAYLLWIELGAPTPLPRRFGGSLPPGRYVYLGSARGPGGLRARCSRHLARPDRRHWHVDWLTPPATRLTVLAFIGGDECNLLGRLCHLPGISVPVPGFGSSEPKNSVPVSFSTTSLISHST